MTELAPNPLPTGVYLPKAVTDYFWRRRPNDLVSGDLDIRFVGRPPTWKPTSAHGLMCHGDTLDLSWRFLVSTNGFPQVYLSMDGTSETLYTSDQALNYVSNINAIRASRNLLSGNLTFYTSRNEGASWQQLGSVIPTTAGALHLSKSNFRVGVAPPGSAAFRGLLRSADIRVNGIGVATLDLTKAWEESKGPWIGSHGYEWYYNGDTALWQTDRTGQARRPQPMELANMFGWSDDLSRAQAAGVAPVSGTVTCARVIIPEDCLITNIHARVVGGGTGVTPAANWFGLYRMDGTQVAVTAALSLSDLGTGFKTFPVVTPVDVPAGIYVVKMLMNASTSPPSFAVSGTSTFVNDGGSATKGYRFWTEDTGQTTGFPTTPGAATSNPAAYLVGVS